VATADFRVVSVRFGCALLVLAGLGTAGCGGSTSHARAAMRPATVRCSRAARYPVRSVHISATRRATTSTQIRHFDPTAWFPDRPGAGCRFGLIVFSPGANSRPVGYAPLLRHLASAGFVVVGVLPMDQTARGDEAAERVDDVTYLLDHLKAIARRLAPALPAELDAGRIGIAGHSFGAFVAAQEAVSEPRIRAALVMAGPLRPGNAGATRVPVLAMTGGADTAVPSRLVRSYYDSLPAALPHGYLQIAGATHGAYGKNCGAQRTCGIVASYATAFFRRYLDGRRSAGRLLDPRAPRSPRVLLRTVDMP
jgi:predicted dienelactone hydrolase